MLSIFCIFEKALFLDPRDSILETRDSILKRFEHRGSSLDVRVSSVNLLLSGTVYDWKSSLKVNTSELVYFSTCILWMINVQFTVDTVAGI